MDVRLFIVVSVSSLSLSLVYTATGSCRDQCDAGRVGNCFCNRHCRRHGDCCHDYQLYCRRGQIGQQTRHQSGGSCSDGCYSGRQGNCFCNWHCGRHGDCCHDFHALCSNSTFRREDGSTPLPYESISEVAAAMWRQDRGRVPLASFNLDFQRVTSSRSRSDVAHRPLFTRVDERFLNQGTYRLFLALLDNYNPDVNVEDLSSVNTTDVDEFLDAIVATQSMVVLRNYLIQQGKLTNSPTALKSLLRQLWFEPYPRRRHGSVSSSGFEHVFVGEKRGSSVTGFHNWIQFYLQEKRGELDYQGFVSKQGPRLIRARFTWLGAQKRGGSILVGVSPEFELALYTLCMTVEPNQDCNVRLMGHDLVLKTFDVRHIPGLQVASAFVTF